ncbi:Fusaric acid resistance protein conserved region [Rhizorhabdus wittichii RW1]|uniref:Fusaric acid resistance protein conserved region n=1 Tax=Rhizorhabdus wittichii (strain DSM 6014 / CCUG 31198 / JCM 15750 / NBRC 105917 / EY 4224 / RW1) TaxID=392499 RepID=A0A9J9HDC0_RHIWR|nr:Fusaric acid resistance protein conserved region [Rhizorhabdus wittichii RW1]
MSAPQPREARARPPPVVTVPPSSRLPDMTSMPVGRTRPRFPSLPLPDLQIDSQKLLFSLSSFIAAAITLAIAFSASLPRPWWALLTVYVTAQPMAGAFRPKALYRLGGIATGAAVTLLLVPNLQNSPELLVLCLAAWTGFCIYLAVLDRTPRAFLFQMAAFSTAVISFPYLDDPTNIFETTIARVQEMTVAILCVTAVHALLQPWSATPVIRARVRSFLAHARRWTAEALGSHHTRLENEHRRMLAADVTELGMIAIHLPFDQRWAPATKRRVTALQQQLASILPLASAAANRLDRLRDGGGLPAELEALLDDVSDWLVEEDSPLHQAGALVRRCEAMAEAAEARADWTSLLTASACVRIAEFLAALAASRRLATRIGSPGRPNLKPSSAEPFALARDHGVAALAGLATATAIALYCAVWILLAWPNGSATAAFAALITCSFAAQDDPAPVIGRYLVATLKTFPLAALYLFVILPRVDGYEMLVITLAPTLLWMGYVQADPARSPQALPMFSCFIVAMGFLARFQADFALFINTGLAQLGGIVATLTVTKLFRSANVLWTARRILRSNWAELAQLADIRRPFLADRWTARAIDRLGQVAARMAVAAPGAALHAADGLADLRIGRNIIPIRRSLPYVPHDVRHRLGAVLSGLTVFYDARWRRGHAHPPPAALLEPIDRALRSLLALPLDEPRRRALRALVGMRCNLFPAAPPPDAVR